MPRWQRSRPKAKSQAGSSGYCQETPALHLNKIDQKWEEMDANQNSEFWTFQDMLPYTTAEVSARDGGSSGRYAVFTLCGTAKATHKQTFRHPLPAWFSWQYLHRWIQLEEIARANRPRISLLSCDPLQYQFPCGQIRAKSISRISRWYVRSIHLGPIRVYSWFASELNAEGFSRFARKCNLLPSALAPIGEMDVPRGRETPWGTGCNATTVRCWEHPFPKVLEIWARCAQAKNLLSSRVGFAPEVLVLGKQIIDCQYPFVVMPLQMQNPVTGHRSAAACAPATESNG